MWPTADILNFRYSKVSSDFQEQRGSSFCCKYSKVYIKSSNFVSRRLVTESLLLTLLSRVSFYIFRHLCNKFSPATLHQPWVFHTIEWQSLIVELFFPTPNIMTMFKMRKDNNDTSVCQTADNVASWSS